MRIIVAALLSAGAAAALAGAAPAQPAGGPPPTEILVAPLRVRGDTLTIGEPVNFTMHRGYDNQPAFTPDGQALLFSSIREGAQADIYRCDLATGELTPLTKTPESEYSPQPLPDGSGFSAVRVEADSTQRIWRFDWDGGNPRPVMATLRGVGYYLWADERTLATFILGTPPTLQIADVRYGTVSKVAEDVGRCFQRIPQRAGILFTMAHEDGTRWIHELTFEPTVHRPLAELPPMVQDFAWLPDGRLVVGDGPTLCVWTSEGSGAWKVVHNFARAAVLEVTRVAISPAGDRIAFVSTEAR